MAAKSKKSDRPGVLIVNGWGDWAGVMRLPGVLRRAGCHVSVFAEPDTKLHRSRYVDRHIAAPPGGQAAFVEALSDHLVVNRYAWVVLGNEPTIEAVAPRATEEWAREIFPVDPHPDRAIDRLLCKATFTEAADAAGVRVPASWGCLALSDLRSAIGAIGLPVIIKPTRGWAGDGVFAIREPAEIERVFDQSKLRAPLIVQRFLDGKVGSTQFLLDRGTPVCWFSSYKTECWPRPFGPSCVREMIEDPQIEPILTKIGRVTGFHGLCGIDWIRTADGLIHVLEFNPRPTPSLELGRFVGVEFSRSIRAMVTGARLIQRPRDARGLVVFMFPQHPARCLLDRDLRGLVNWLPFVAKHSVPWNEPKILFGDLRVLARQARTMVKADIRRTIGSLKNALKRLLRLRRQPAGGPPAPATRAG